MTATEATIGELNFGTVFLPTFDGNIRVLTIAYKDNYCFLQ